MPVLPKYQLKALWEAGDLITQTTSHELIEACYNPTLVAGTNVTLNSVTTPSGTTITINSTGGGSGTVTGGLNLGPGVGVFKDLLGSNLRFKTLIAGANTSIQAGVNTVTISSSASAGAQGAQGAQGTSGAQGSTGAQGNQGFQGTGGTAGAQGATGAQGSAGVGSQGAQGFQGSQGPQGFQGTTGSGAQGSTGAQGNQGFQGTDGAQGAQGFQGASGAGTNYQAGDGINIDTATNPDTIEVDLGDGCGTYGPNLGFDSNGDLDFLGMHVYDEGVSIGTFPVINFIGVDVLSQPQGDPDGCVVDVYIPPPTFSPYFNQQNSTRCTVNPDPFTNPRISNPTSEGTPYKLGTGNAGGDWYASSGAANNQHPAWEAANTTSALTFTVNSNNTCTGFGGNSTMTVTVYDADGTTVLTTHTTGSIAADGPYGNGTTIDVTITNYATDTTKFKATPTVSIQIGTILSAAGYEGGRFHVYIAHTTDTGTDTGTTYTFIGPQNSGLALSQGAYGSNGDQIDAFLDWNRSGGASITIPQITGLTPSGSVGPTIIESPTGTINTKFISGVKYYKLNSEFQAEVQDIMDFNSNTQGRSNVNNYNLQLTSPGNPGNYGLSNLNIKAWNPTASQGTFTAGSGTWPDGWNAQNVDWIISDWGITASGYRFRSTAANITAQPFDPWASGTLRNSDNKAVLIDTVETQSTKLQEYFDAENERLSRTGSYTAFQSNVVLTPSGLTNQTTSALATGPFCDACVVGGELVRPDKFYADNGNSPQTGTLIGDLSITTPNPPYPWIPTQLGGGPDYSAVSYQVAATFHRLFEVSASNQNRDIASFELQFYGTFPLGDVFDELVANNLLVYIRKKSALVSTNVGYGADPHSLHNTGTFQTSGPNIYTDPPTAIDNNGNSQCRTTTFASSNLITGSFGTSTSQPFDGFYIEVHIVDPNVRITRIDAKVIFASGNPTTEG